MRARFGDGKTSGEQLLNPTPFGRPASRNANWQYSVSFTQATGVVVRLGSHDPDASVVPLMLSSGNVSNALQNPGSAMCTAESPKNHAAGADAAARVILFANVNDVVEPL